MTAVHVRHVVRFGVGLEEEIRKRAELARRTLMDELIYLAERALGEGLTAAPIDHDSYQLAGASGAPIGIKTPADIARRIDDRKRITGESRSEAWRALVMAGLAMDDGDGDGVKIDMGGARRVSGMVIGAEQLLADVCAHAGAEIASRASAATEDARDGDHGPDEEWMEFARWLAHQCADVAMSSVVGALVERGYLTPDGQLGLLDEDIDAIEAEAGKAARTQYYLTRILDLVDETPPDVPPRLYPEELEELAEIVREVEASPREAGVQYHARVQALWAIAQPGMMFLRGDKEAWERWEKAKDAGLMKRVDEIMAKRDETDRLLAGDLSPDDVQDVVGVLAQLRGILEPVRERIQGADAELRQMELRARPLRTAIERLEALGVT